MRHAQPSAFQAAAPKEIEAMAKPKRSITAQIEEVTEILEAKRSQAKSMRGSDLSRAEEHILRLECALTTLQWVRDHADIIRQMARVDKSGQRDRSEPDKDKTS